MQAQAKPSRVALLRYPASQSCLFAPINNRSSTNVWKRAKKAQKTQLCFDVKGKLKSSQRTAKLVLVCDVTVFRSCWHMLDLCSRKAACLGLPCKECAEIVPAAQSARVGGKRHHEWQWHVSQTSCLQMFKACRLSRTEELSWKRLPPFSHVE